MQRWGFEMPSNISIGVPDQGLQEMCKNKLECVFTFFEFSSLLNLIAQLIAIMVYGENLKEKLNFPIFFNLINVTALNHIIFVPSTNCIVGHYWFHANERRRSHWFSGLYSR